MRCVLLALLLLSNTLVGCRDTSRPVVLVNSSVTAPALLRSEAAQVAIPVRIDAPLVLENRSDVEQLVGIARTGCSCYGMATADFILGPGEQIKLPARGRKELFFVSDLLEADGDQGFRVGLAAPGNARAAGDASTEELRADCSMKILPDLLLEPASTVVDPPRGQEQLPGREYPLVLKRITRGKPVSAASPEFSITPALLKAGPFRRDGEPEEVEAGLWRTTWKSSLVLEPLPADLLANGGQFPFTVEFPISEEETPAAAATRRAEHAIPTVMDVIRPDPERRIYGQIMLRRSIGIVAPAELHFGSLALASGKRTRRLVLTSADQVPFVVTVGKTPLGVNVAVDSEEPAVQQWVTITLEPFQAGNFDDALTLGTSHPADPEVRVNLKARIK